MYWPWVSGFSLWWLLPIVMMVICFLVMRRWGCPMMYVCGSRYKDKKHGNESDSAVDILAKRYAHGEISKEEYEDGRRVIERGK
jgi:uncharacterized membrane protein